MDTERYHALRGAAKILEAAMGRVLDEAEHGLAALRMLSRSLDYVLDEADKLIEEITI